MPRIGDDPGVPDRATLAIRTTGDPSAEIGPVRATLSGLDRAVPVSNILRAGDLLSGTAAGPRLNMILLSVLGGLAIGLAAIGVYGLTAYAVRQRAREIAIRAALDGRPLALLRLLLGEGLTLIAAELVAGLGCALLATNLMTRLPFEIAPSDPATFGLATGLLLAVSCAAVCLPAWRALRVDIAPTLRSVE